MPGAQILTPSRTDFDTDVEARRDDNEGDYSGWFCVSTSPFPCPASGCDFVARHVTAAHLVVVWPRRDDRALLELANDAQRLGRNPRIVEYDPSFGYPIPYDLWVQMGRPVHGRRQRPGDVPYQPL